MFKIETMKKESDAVKIINVCFLTTFGEEEKINKLSPLPPATMLTPKMKTIFSATHPNS